jgi:hypothetical protein
MRFRLRTLLIVLALAPPILAIAYLTIAPKPKPHRPQAGPWIDRATFQGNRQYSDKKLARLIGLKSSTGIHGATSEQRVERKVAKPLCNGRGNRRRNCRAIGQESGATSSKKRGRAKTKSLS